MAVGVRANRPWPRRHLEPLAVIMVEGEVVEEALPAPRFLALPVVRAEFSAEEEAVEVPDPYPPVDQIPETERTVAREAFLRAEEEVGAAVGRTTPMRALEGMVGLAVEAVAPAQAKVHLEVREVQVARGLVAEQEGLPVPVGPGGPLTAGRFLSDKVEHCGSSVVRLVGAA